MKKVGALFCLLTVVLAASWMTVVPAEVVNTYSAGVGEEDRQERSEYSLKIITFVRGGPYLANVLIHVKNLDTNTVVFKGRVQGPWLFVGLPPGVYSILGERANGDRQGMRVIILAGAPQAEAALVFPER